MSSVVNGFTMQVDVQAFDLDFWRHPQTHDQVHGLEDQEVAERLGTRSPAATVFAPSKNSLSSFPSL